MEFTTGFAGIVLLIAVTSGAHSQGSACGLEN